MIQSCQQRFAVIEPFGIHREPHILAKPALASLSAWLERREGRAQRAGDIELAELHYGISRLRIHRLRVQPNVARHSRVRMARAGDFGVVRAEMGALGIAADDWLGIVRGTAGGEGAHDGKFIVQLRELFKCGAKRDTRQSCGDLAGHTANTRGRAHFRIKRLRLRGSAVHEKEHHRFILGHAAEFLQGILRPQKLRQRQPAKRKAAHGKEIPAAGRVVS